MLTLVGVACMLWYDGSLEDGEALGLIGLVLAPLVLLALKRWLLLACVGYWLSASVLLLVFCAREGGLRPLLLWFGAASITFVEALGVVWNFGWHNTQLPEGIGEKEPNDAGDAPEAR